MNLRDQIKADIESHEILACHKIHNALAAVNFAGMEHSSSEKAGYNVSNGIATINVRGLLVPSMSADYSDYGITGYNHIAEYVMAAESDPAVQKIVLDVDSGGGYVSGINEPTRAIASASKPVEAFVSGSMYSAAYWLGATADTITAKEEGGIGSIGVYNVHVEKSKAYEDRGVKFSIFRSGKLKGAFNDFMPLSDEESEILQASVTKSASNFFNHVADRRNITASKVEGWDGACFDAEQAKEYGLIDNISNKPTQTTQTSEEDSMTLEQALAANKELQDQVSAKDAELKAFKDSARESDIKALAEKTGREFTMDELAQMKAMDKASFDFATSLIPAKAEQPKVPQAFFEEQAIQGKNADNIDDLDSNIAKWAGV